MKMNKVTKALSLALALALAATPVSAFAASSPSSSSTAAVVPVITPTAQTNVSAGDVSVSTKADGTAVITEVSNDKIVTIGGTTTVNGVTYKNTTVGKGTFEGCDEVESVTISGNVTNFSSGAFTGAESLETIKINTTKKVKVSVNAFKGLEKGQKITIKYKKSMSAKNAKALEKQFKAAAKKAGIKVVFKKVK